MRNFFSTCVRWPPHLHGAKDFLDDQGQKITREEFLPLVNRAHMRRIEKDLGYDRTQKIEDDWHVGYFLEPETGIPFFVHSATEHVFASEEELERLEALTRSETLIIRNPADLDRREACDPDAWDSLLQEVLNAAGTHPGPVLVIDDGSFPSLYETDRMMVMAIIASREDWGAKMVSTSPQDGFVTMSAEEIDVMVSKITNVRDLEEELKQQGHDDDPQP